MASVLLGVERLHELEIQLVEVGFNTYSLCDEVLRGPGVELLLYYLQPLLSLVEKCGHRTRKALVTIEI